MAQISAVTGVASTSATVSYSSSSSSASTGLSTNTDVPPAPGSSLSGLSDLFTGKSASTTTADGKMRNAFLSHLTLPSVPLDTSDDDS